MYFSDEMVRAAERRYGVPQFCAVSYPASEREIAIVRSSQAGGRKHDITMAIFGRPGVIVIAKPWYTVGLYRLPSGGLRPGEALETGAAREAREETGVEMELVRYHLRIDVDFVGSGATVPWTSHVFSARHISGDVKALDTEEIREARWCALPELLAHRAIMLKSTVSGLRYRAELQDLFLAHLEALGWLENASAEPSLLPSPLSAVGPGA
jgi:8-oxo-dGTP pyrophosphatase MutT (NUDIX family)